MDNKELDKNKKLFQMTKSKPISFSKPCTKLENLEDSLLNPSVDSQKTNSKGLLKQKSLQSSSLVNTLNNNVLPYTENKKNLLQRSISEKLRNSFKNKTNNLNQTILPKQSSNFNTYKIEPRKWHSERYKKNNVSLVSNNYLVHKPLSSIQKAILDNYTPKKRLPKNALKKFDDFDTSDSESESDCEIRKAKPVHVLKNSLVNDESDSDFEKLDKNGFLSRIKAIDSDSDDSFFSENESSMVFFPNGNPFYDLNVSESTIIGSNTSQFYDLMNDNEYSSEWNYYERVLPTRFECQICYELTYVNKRKCCDFNACNTCINQYIQSQIKGCCGNVRIECLNNNCTKLIHRDEINERMTKYDKDALNLYLKLLVDANKNPNSKTCPRCSHVMTLDLIENSKTSSLKTKRSRNSKKNSNLITKCQCIECQLVWCFQCHAPWHDGITCNEFKKGDRMLKYWAKEVHYGQQNAQLCPKCNIYIQRTKGCDHMICPICHNEFCYKCGKKFRSFKFIGDHYSKLSVLGCKYKLFPEKPAKRKFIRGSVLGAKIVAVPFVAGFGLVVGVGVLAVGCVALPVYGSYKLAKRIKTKQKIRRELRLDDDESTGIDYIARSADGIDSNQENKNCKETDEEVLNSASVHIKL